MEPSRSASQAQARYTQDRSRAKSLGRPGLEHRFTAEAYRNFGEVGRAILEGFDPATKAGRRALFLVMAVLDANHADGEAYHSIATLGRYAGMSERCAQDHASALVASGCVEYVDPEPRRRAQLPYVYRTHFPGKPRQEARRPALTLVLPPAESAPPATPAYDLREHVQPRSCDHHGDLDHVAAAGAACDTGWQADDPFAAAFSSYSSGPRGGEELPDVVEPGPDLGVDELPPLEAYEASGAPSRDDLMAGLQDLAARAEEVDAGGASLPRRPDSVGGGVIHSCDTACSSGRGNDAFQVSPAVLERYRAKRIPGWERSLRVLEQLARKHRFDTATCDRVLERMLQRHAEIGITAAHKFLHRAVEDVLDDLAKERERAYERQKYEQLNPPRKRVPKPRETEPPQQGMTAEEATAAVHERLGVVEVVEKHRAPREIRPPEKTPELLRRCFEHVCRIYEKHGIEVLRAQSQYMLDYAAEYAAQHGLAVPREPRDPPPGGLGAG